MLTDVCGVDGGSGWCSKARGRSRLESRTHSGGFTGLAKPLGGYGPQGQPSGPGAAAAVQGLEAASSTEPGLSPTQAVTQEAALMLAPTQLI